VRQSLSTAVADAAPRSKEPQSTIKQRKRHTLETVKFAETVIGQVHAKTLQGGLTWEINRDRVAAEPTPNIRVTINFDDDGPDSAIWQNVMITHPVGVGVTLLGNSASPKAKLFVQVKSGKMLDQINEIFRYVLLEPRKKEFEAAMKELLGVSHL
jgi:hypothetical protein